jgi:hypothetical protein
MAHLPEDRGELGDDLPAERRRQRLPDAAGIDRHASSLSPAVATSSSSASTLSLVDVRRGRGCRCRFVAGIGSIIKMPGR